MIEDVKIKIYDYKKYGIPWILWKKFENTFFLCIFLRLRQFLNLKTNEYLTGGKVP